MSKLIRTLMGLGIAAGLAGGTGFIVFAENVRTLVPDEKLQADAIVVLTGDEERIATGVRLMVEGRGRRLLISGVYPTTRMPTEVKRRIDGADAKRRELVRCCIDIGHEAMNTSGNAEEAREWVSSNGFRSLVLVTSGYHMLRGRTEFQRVMPDIVLIDYPVGPSRNLRLDTWWRHWPTARLLAGEYIKFLGAYARLAVWRTIGLSEGPTRPLPRPGDLPSASANSGSGQ